MKTRFMLLTLLLAATAALQADPPRLVPRPIPGMAAPAASQTTSALMKPPPARQAASPTANDTERARVLFIHRRATLPAELTKNLSASRPVAAAPAQMLNMRQSAVRIIPKSELAQISPQKP